MTHCFQLFCVFLWKHLKSILRSVYTWYFKTMLQALSRLNTENHDLHTKCAEIHFQRGNWHYSCAFCGLLFVSNDEILTHLKAKHSKQFMFKEIPLQNHKIKLVTTSKKKSSKIKLDDPLRCSPIHEKNEADTLTADIENTQILTLEQDFDESFLESDVKIEEFQDLSNTSNKSSENHESNENSQAHHYQNDDFELSSPLIPDKIDYNENNDDTKEEDPSAYYEISDETESISDNQLQNESEIDWSTPFKPLKNREKRSYRPRKQPFSCPYCGCTYLRRYQFDAHMNSHTGAKPFLCEICARQFRAIATLKNHLVTHDKRLISCSYCDKSFPNNSALLHHEKRHTEVRNESCDLCEKRFLTLKHLETHKERVHKNRKILVCKYCNKSFSHKTAHFNHEKRHTQERTNPCDLCGKQFYTWNQLDTHLRRIHEKSDGVLPFACNMCSKRYRSSSMLSLHKTRKHRKPKYLEEKV